MCGCLQSSKRRRYYGLNPSSLSIDCFTCSRSIHESFDYESEKVITKHLSISNSVKIIRNRKDITIAGRNVEVSKEVKILANIGIIKDQYWIYSLSGISSAEEKLWISLRKYVGENEVEGYKLSERAVIRMGRCKYTVKELVAFPEIIKTADNMGTEEENGLKNVVNRLPEVLAKNLGSNSAPLSKGEERQCRVCLGEDNSPPNKLIESPCMCIGSVRLIHVDCLKQWLKSKVNKKCTEVSTTYIWKQFECDVCRAKYPGTSSSYIRPPHHHRPRDSQHNKAFIQLYVARGRSRIIKCSKDSPRHTVGQEESDESGRWQSKK
eukprot:TRINITY_DN1598_c0_g3_i1.p1 TRINITY_DN1598_c0_g3~~TRINITY_DN1598_c0_g3_i1.p1  ORF type:complete len:322 (+),score=24.22 TRINITY_DN1598_c0_g3_i1:86-1051(+)